MRLLHGLCSAIVCLSHIIYTVYHTLGLRDSGDLISIVDNVEASLDPTMDLYKITHFKEAGGPMFKTWAQCSKHTSLLLI